MFLLALIALSVLVLGLTARFAATGNKAAIRAAAEANRPDTGMPAGSTNNHPVSLREVRVTSDASSPSAPAGVCPASESDDLETRNHATADASVPTSTHGLPPSASPDLIRGCGKRGSEHATD